jgi:hypothetical protein
MMRLPSATSVSTRQTSWAVRGEVVFKSFYARVIACPAMRWCAVNGQIAPSGQWARLADRTHLSKVVVKYQNDAGNVPATFVKPLRDGGENRSPGVANLRGFVFSTRQPRR